MEKHLVVSAGLLYLWQEYLRDVPEWTQEHTLRMVMVIEVFVNLGIVFALVLVLAAYEYEYHCHFCSCPSRCSILEDFTTLPDSVV